MPATKKAPATQATPGPKYAAAHCFFIDGVLLYPSTWPMWLAYSVAIALNDRECDRLADSPAGQALRTLKEIYVNFWGTSLVYKPS